MSRDRVDDANEDLFLSMTELRSIGLVQDVTVTTAVVRVLGSIAVTLAMIYDHMNSEAK